MADQKYDYLVVATNWRAVGPQTIADTSTVRVYYWRDAVKLANGLMPNHDSVSIYPIGEPVWADGSEVDHG